ncbi:MAG: Txe/YoeB family addiction module toxin [Planctomycetales bacterium]|nr:Txe/YoeB family addiction module toxin [Planctomycetales bacterium]
MIATLNGESPQCADPSDGRRPRLAATSPGDCHPARKPRDTVFPSEFRFDLKYSAKPDRTIAQRVLETVEAVRRDPFTEIVQPERLKHRVAGAWSRRLMQEHRVAYPARDERSDLRQARYHCWANRRRSAATAQLIARAIKTNEIGSGITDSAVTSKTARDFTHEPSSRSVHKTKAPWREV